MPKEELDEYISIIEMMTNKFPYAYREELIQEGWIGMSKALAKFDPDKGTLLTFSWKYIYGAMVDYLRKEKNYTTSSLDEWVSNEEGEPTTFADLLESEEDLEGDYIKRDYFEQNLNNSTPIERFIKQKYYIDNMSVNKIIELYNQYHMINSKKTIYKILKK